MAKSKYDYWFAPKAESDLDELLAHIEHKLFNPKAALDFAIELFDKIDYYRVFPELGIKVDNEFVINKDLRKFFVGNYIAFYIPNKESRTIIIVRIVYGGRNVGEMLRTEDFSGE